MSDILEVFEGIVKLDSSILKEKLEMIKLDEEKEHQFVGQDQELIDSCQIFILNFCEEIAIKFQTQTQILNRKKKSQPKEIDEIKKEMKSLERAAATVIEICFNKISGLFDGIFDYLEKTCQDKPEDGWEGMDKKYASFSAAVSRVL